MTQPRRYELVLTPHSRRALTDRLPEAVVYIPVSGITGDRGRVRSVQVPAAELMITTHHGSAADIDLAYADLGSYLAEHHLRVAHQIREHYLCDQSDTPDETRWQTEIAWPILTG